MPPYRPFFVITFKNQIMKENKYFNLTIVFTIMVLAFAVFFRVFTVYELPGQLLAAIIGVAITAVITQILLKGQGSQEMLQNRNAKIFEEKLTIYKDFLQKLCDVVKDQHIDDTEEIELQFQVANIAMHTSTESIEAISGNVKDIVLKIKEEAEDQKELLNPLFNIADVFYKELYGEENKIEGNVRQVTLSNFESFLVRKEDISSYEAQNNKATVAAYQSKENLPFATRLKVLKAMIEPHGARQFIWQGKVLAHEYFADINPSTKKLVKGKNCIAIDLSSDDTNIIITLFTRQSSEEASRQLVRELWDEKVSYQPWVDSSRHLYKKLPLSTADTEVAAAISELLVVVGEYRNRKLGMA